MNRPGSEGQGDGEEGRRAEGEEKRGEESGGENTSQSKAQAPGRVPRRAGAAILTHIVPGGNARVTNTTTSIWEEVGNPGLEEQPLPLPITHSLDFIL